MRCVLVVLSLWSMSLYAYDDAYIASIEKSANDRASVYNSDVKQLSDKLLSAKNGRQNTQLSRGVYELTKPTEPIATHLKKVSQIIVFLSFSMPEKSLEAWLLQCRQSGATPVIRGLIHNSFHETMIAIRRLSQKTGAGVQLDPILFKTFDIQVVPAVVYAKDTPACPSNMDCKTVEYDKLYGDVSLDYALEKISGHDEANDAALNEVIHRLRGGLL